MEIWHVTIIPYGDNKGIANGFMVEAQSALDAASRFDDQGIVVKVIHDDWQE